MSFNIKVKKRKVSYKEVNKILKLYFKNIDCERELRPFCDKNRCIVFNFGDIDFVLWANSSCLDCTNQRTTTK